ncbi:MobF family relaxase [Arthrobacter bambusae]|uniref:Conjugative relaxase-like TrwC/TraI family protein n=2 Tax=Arthrobacter bambusae TaxID=1338426 RepID=A0AAW8DEH2_9MICC|nr:MobF family relaxase [Arthrobacter bambusae]MDP9906173.1 conjugative relaxase-like TrwC/TraI family protein [Arthrobacter bambusae]MDQ0182269.1 conjugative relaxase-like TrwC/TraI family protein [Arthrobacter bambusae]
MPGLRLPALRGCSRGIAVTMSIARLSADAGVKYLLKTTAHGDVTVRNLTDYYTTSGNPPGTWLGAGMDGIGLAPGTVLTDDSARAVFEGALHPVTGEPLGRRHGQRATVPAGPGPKTGTSARYPVAGFDLTFSVPKSVSVLWALSPQAVRDRVLAAHHRALRDTLVWLECRAIGTRTGRNGVAHVPVRGAIAAAFDHWESRAGDPQLHTHLVIANRVQRTSDGAWTTLDSRTLYKAVVAASEHYNGLLFDELRRSLGTETELRAPASAERNPSRELSGVDAGLITEFSARARVIELEKDRLVRLWKLEHGRNPSDATVLKLRQQATLSTRTAKDAQSVPLAERLTSWRRRAEGLGCTPERLITATVEQSRTRPLTGADLSPEWRQVTGQLVMNLVAQKRATWNRWNLLAEAERVCADLRMANPAERAAMIEALADSTQTFSVPLNDYRYIAPDNARADLAADGHTVFDPLTDQVFTSARILADEEAIMAASHATDAPGLEPWDAVTAATATPDSGEPVLFADQQDAAIQVLSSRRRLDALTGPAGAGKTATMKAVSDAWQQVHGPGSVVALAPAAVSADVLGDALGLGAENVTKWLYESNGPGAANRARRYLLAEHALEHHLDTGPIQRRQRQAAQVLAAVSAEQSRWQLRPGQLVIIDEASMVPTYQLAALTGMAAAAGAKMVLVGDPAQLDSIDAGGMLGWLDRTGRAVRLTSLHRFTHAWESAASLQLRAGNWDGVLEYERHGRIVAGTDGRMIESAYAGWAADEKAGLASILIAPDNDTVTVLNRRAQEDRAATGAVDTRHTVPLADGLTAGCGDVILARRNDRRIRDSLGGFIRNGTLLTITAHPTEAGTVSCVRKDTGATINLDRSYLSGFTELGYATTAHRSQGITVDTGHIVVTEGRLTRELFYVGMTRGRTTNTAYVVEPDTDADERIDPIGLPGWPEILGQVLAAEGAEHTAHETRQELQDSTDTLHQLAAEHDYLTQIAADEDLTDFLTTNSPGSARDLRRSPAWGPAVAAWKRLAAHDRNLAEREVLNAMTPRGGVRDLTAIIHNRLRAAANLHGAPEGLLRCPGNRPDLSNLVTQVEQRIRNRAKLVAAHIPTSQEPWVQALASQLRNIPDPDRRRRTLREILIYRDRWAITDNTNPLGTPVSWEEPDMQNQRQRLQTKLSPVIHPRTGPATENVHPYQPSHSTRDMGLRI